MLPRRIDDIEISERAILKIGLLEGSCGCFKGIGSGAQDIRTRLTLVDIASVDVAVKISSLTSDIEAEL